MLLVFYVTGKRRGLGKYWADHYLTTDNIEEADVILNCKHETQLDVLYKAAELGTKIINIGSNSPDQHHKKSWRYAAEKSALDYANDQLYRTGLDTTNLRFGYFDTERVAHIDKPKLSLDEVEEIILWILTSPHRIKQLTIESSQKAE